MFSFRDNYVYTTEKTGSRQLRCHKTPHYFSQIFPASILQLMQDVAEITSFVIIKEGSAAFQRYLPPKHTLHGVVFAKMIVCPWHIHITPDANALFSLLQRAPAYSTLTREEEMDKGQEPGFKCVFHKKV